MDALSRYLQPHTRTNYRLWLTAIAIVLLVVWSGMHAWQQVQRAEQIRQRTERLVASQAKVVVPAPSRSDQETQKRWAALKVERDFDWKPLFQAVEHASGSDIELLEFQPDKRNRTVMLRGEARDHKALIAFLNALTAQAVLGNVYLVHQQNVQRERLETIAFEIKATLLQ